MKLLNAWDIVGDDTGIRANRDGYDVTLNIYSDIIARNEGLALSCTIEHNDDLVLRTKLSLESEASLGEGNLVPLARLVLDNILPHVSPRARIVFDRHGPFIELGREDGLMNCDLVISPRDSIDLRMRSNASYLRTDQYRIRKNQTMFSADSTNMEKFRNRFIAAVYKVDSLFVR